MEKTPNRREAVKTVTVVVAGVVTTVAVPTEWTKPIVESIIVPAHAATSRAATTTSGPTGAPTITPTAGPTSQPTGAFDPQG